jgi:hypothetical protein
MRATTSIRNGVLMLIGALFVIGLVGIGVHHPASHERARSLGPPAGAPAQVEGSNATAPASAPAAPAVSPALGGVAATTGGSGLAAQGTGAVAAGSAPIPNTGAPSMLVPGCLLLALALGARRLAKKAA